MFGVLLSAISCSLLWKWNNGFSFFSEFTTHKIYVIEYEVHLSFPKCILSEWSVFALHYGGKSMSQKVGIFINSFWLLDIINVSEFGKVKQCFALSTQSQIRQSNANAGDQSTHLIMLLCALQQQHIEKFGRNSSSYTHYFIIDGCCPGQVHLFFSISVLCQAAERWIGQPCQQHYTHHSPIQILIIISLDNPAPDTFYNIMWNRSKDRINETAWWMLFFTASRSGFVSV